MRDLLPDYPKDAREAIMEAARHMERHACWPKRQGGDYASRVTRLASDLRSGKASRYEKSFDASLPCNAHSSDSHLESLLRVISALNGVDPSKQPHLPNDGSQELGLLPETPLEAAAKTAHALDGSDATVVSYDAYTQFGKEALNAAFSDLGHEIESVSVDDMPCETVRVRLKLSGKTRWLVAEIPPMVSVKTTNAETMDPP